MSGIDFYDVDPGVAEKFAISLQAHIAYVQEAARDLGVPESQAEIHDLSKWDKAEFAGFARHFHGGGAPDEFSKAWLHHIHHNPHHWQHWIFPDGYTPQGSSVENGVVEMPEHYALEMVANWLGTSRAYTGSGDMTDWWLGKHLPEIRVHSQTRAYLIEILNGLGYACYSIT